MKLIMALVLYGLLISQVSLQFGVTQEVWTTPSGLVEPTEDCSGFLCSINAAIQAVLVPLRWAFNTVAVIVALMTYQVEGIPALINTVIISPIGAGILWLTAKLVRG
jgi:hypothetical protein